MTFKNFVGICSPAQLKPKNFNNLQPIPPSEPFFLVPGPVYGRIAEKIIWLFKPA